MVHNILIYYNYNYINYRNGSRVYCDTFISLSLHINEIHSYLEAYVPTICHYNSCHSHLKGVPNHDTHQSLFCL